MDYRLTRYDDTIADLTMLEGTTTRAAADAEFVDHLVERLNMLPSGTLTFTEQQALRRILAAHKAFQLDILEAGVAREVFPPSSDELVGSEFDDDEDEVPGPTPGFDDDEDDDLRVDIGHMAPPSFEPGFEARAMSDAEKAQMDAVLDMLGATLRAGAAEGADGSAEDEGRCGTCPGCIADKLQRELEAQFKALGLKAHVEVIPLALPFDPTLN